MSSTMPTAIAAALGALAVPALTPFQGARALHVEAMAALRQGEPLTAAQRCNEALKALESARRLTPIMRDLKRNIERTRASIPA